MRSETFGMVALITFCTITLIGAIAYATLTTLPDRLTLLVILADVMGFGGLIVVELFSFL